MLPFTALERKDRFHSKSAQRVRSQMFDVPRVPPAVSTTRRKAACRTPIRQPSSAPPNRPLSDSCGYRNGDQRFPSPVSNGWLPRLTSATHPHAWRQPAFHARRSVNRRARLNPAMPAFFPYRFRWRRFHHFHHGFRGAFLLAIRRVAWRVLRGRHHFPQFDQSLLDR